MEKVRYLTTEEWAALHNIHPQQVRDLCREGRIVAEKIGSVWRIPYVEPPQVLAEERVSKAVDEIVRPCVAVVDAALDALMAMKGQLMLQAKGAVNEPED